MKLQAGKTYRRRDGGLESIVLVKNNSAYNSIGGCWDEDGWRYVTFPDCSDLIEEVPSSDQAFTETAEAGLSIVRQSDTPETDAIYFDDCQSRYDLAGLCKKLERERNDLLRRLTELEHSMPVELARLEGEKTNFEKMKSHYPGCMSDEECKCQDYDNEIEDESTCMACGNTLQLVRPGKHQCDHCETNAQPTPSSGIAAESEL